MQPHDVLGGRFELVGELGRGGTAVVWLATDREHDDRQIALKILHDAVADDPLVRSRLGREVEAARRLHHPGALLPRALHDLDGRLMLELPLHPGVTLDEHVRTHGSWTGDAVMRLAKRLAEVLAESHAAGIVHRDVTPRNVMVDDTGHAVLTDFGLARLDGATRTATAAAPAGTPGYLAPEILEGQRAGPAADLYGLGAVLYVAATGRAPFEGPTAAAVLRNQIDGRHTPLAQARPDLPPDLARTVDALLRPDPDRRPAGAREVLAWLDGRRPAEPADATTIVDATLPAGSCAVEIREHEGDLRRRRLRRRRHRTRHPFAAQVEQAFQEVYETAHRMLDRPVPRVPEEALVAAIAQRAHLPPDALEESPVLYDRHFLLVDGVDRATAEHLAADAREAGFSTRVRDLALPVPWTDHVRRAFLPLLPTLIVLLTPAPDWVAGIVFLAATVPAWLAIGRRQLPRAYGRDLSPHLADGYRARSVPTPTPAPASTPDTAHDPAALAIRVRERITGVRKDLSAHPGLPDLARRDLEEALRDLLSEVDGLASALRSEATAPDSVEEADAVATVTARLRRLETLTKAGRPADADEVRRLQQALDRHRAALELAEQAEARRVQRLARLLEIGTVVLAIRDQLDESAPEPSRDRLQTLKREVDAARRALHATRLPAR